MVMKRGKTQLKKISILKERLILSLNRVNMPRIKVKRVAMGMVIAVITQAYIQGGENE
jgi:hypothetical protein